MPGPTVVLVHGAFADASGFAGVIRELESAGHTALAPPNPLRGVAFDASVVSDVVKAIDGPVVLVGHSYGGAVIGQASAWPGERDRPGLSRGVRAGGGRELRERAAAVPAASARQDGRPDPLRRARRRGRSGPVRPEGRVPGDVLRRRAGGHGRCHVRDPAPARRWRSTRTPPRRSYSSRPGSWSPGTTTRSRDHFRQPERLKNSKGLLAEVGVEIGR